MAYKCHPSVYRSLQWIPRLVVLLPYAIFDNDQTPPDDTHDLPQFTGFPQILKEVFFTFFADVDSNNYSIAY